MSILFFLNYFLFLFLGAIAINGFFCITRGEMVIMPNGSEEKSGKIGREWYFFWFKETNRLRDFYEGDQLLKLLVTLRRVPNMNIKEHGTTAVTIGSILTDIDVKSAESALGVKAHAEYVDEETLLYFYEDKIEYRFPWWLRTVMAGCVTCHSSWLGSIIFWAGVLLAKTSDVQLIFNFTNNVTVAALLTWVVYCISLAFVTTVLYKKL